MDSLLHLFQMLLMPLCFFRPAQIRPYLNIRKHYGLICNAQTSLNTADLEMYMLLLLLFL